MKKKMGIDGTVRLRHTAISRMGFEKSALENPETYCGGGGGGGGGTHLYGLYKGVLPPGSKWWSTLMVMIHLFVSVLGTSY